MSDPHSNLQAAIAPNLPNFAKRSSGTRSLGLRRSAGRLSLEPRLMFDGAGMITAADAGAPNAEPAVDAGMHPAPPPPIAEDDNDTPSDPAAGVDSAPVSPGHDDFETDADNAGVNAATTSPADTTSGEVAYPASGGNSADSALSSGIEINNDGGNDVFFQAESGIVNDLDAVTYEIVFAENNVHSEAAFVSYNFGTNDEFAIQTIDDGRLEFDVGTSVYYSNVIDYNAALRDGQVHALAFTWDNTNGDWSLYIDGARVDSGTNFATGDVIRGGGTFQIGQEQDTARPLPHDPDQVFSGTLHDVRLWSVARTAAEIFDNDEHKLDAPVPGLLANWQMTSLAGGDTVVDIVNPGGNDLVVMHTADPRFTASEARAGLSVDEQAAAGTVIGRLFPSAPEATGSGSTYRFSLIDNPGGAFRIDADSGEIRVANGSAIDFEQRRHHELRVEVTPHSGGVSGSAFIDTVRIDVNDIDEPLAVRTPAIQQVTTGETLTFATALGNALTVNDQGPTDNTLRVSLSADHGVITLGAGQGIVLLSGADGTASMRIEGSESAVRSALEGLTYRPFAGFVGADLLLVSGIDVATGERAQGTVTIDISAPEVTTTELARPRALTPPEPQAPGPLPPPPVDGGAAETGVEPHRAELAVTVETIALEDVPTTSGDLVDEAESTAPHTEGAQPAVVADATSLPSKSGHHGQSFAGAGNVTVANVAALPESVVSTIADLVEEELLMAAESEWSDHAVTAAGMFPSLALATTLFDVLDEMQSQIVLDGYTEVELRLIVGTFSLSLSVGYLLWMLKGSLLMGGVFSVKNLTRNLDPLAVIASESPKRRLLTVDEETVESFFDNVRPA